MRSGELLLAKFQDKKASGEKEIFVIDSKGVAGKSAIERYEKEDFLKSYVKDTLEATGVVRKSEITVTPKQKRSSSTNSADRSPKVMLTTTIQHFQIKPTSVLNQIVIYRDDA
ncbi:unnamed protein product [Adineta ricciae]|uniref:Uncharacterized protein n=1 Tax=Adineta ricciae TaxID=249248 RepID=A0A815MYB3_ADIRI|nr:unnamed protein product [Adineta ricciae]